MTGSYAIGAGGFGYITSALFSGLQIRGMVSNGVFIGSSTEGGFNDLFIAGQIPASPPTTSYVQRDLFDGLPELFELLLMEPLTMRSSP